MILPKAGDEGNTTNVLVWGGGYNTNPTNQYAAGGTWYNNRAMVLKNRFNKDLFIPDSTDAEKRSVFNSTYLHANNAKYVGDWHCIIGFGYGPTQPNNLRKDMVGVGADCWNWYPPDQYKPSFAACPAGTYGSDTGATYSDGSLVPQIYGPVIQHSNWPLRDRGDGIATTYWPDHYNSTVPVADWQSTFGYVPDVIMKGGFTSPPSNPGLQAHFPQSLHDGYFWQCPSAYPYRWISIKFCYIDKAYIPNADPIAV